MKKNISLKCCLIKRNSKVQKVGDLSVLTHMLPPNLKYHYRQQNYHFQYNLKMDA